MPGGLGPRFALEAGFLILLAAVAAYAQLDATEIILVMAAGWLLASVFEVLAARRERVYTGATWERRVETDEAPADVEDAVEEPEERRLSWSRRPEDAASASSPPEPVDEPPVSDSPPAPSSRTHVDDESTGEIKLPKRRWFRRGGGRPELPEHEPEARPSARHVRLIRDSPSEEDDLEPRHDVEARP
jgi:hypothetical protein